jgi:hypothetical protein
MLEIAGGILIAVVAIMAMGFLISLLNAFVLDPAVKKQAKKLYAYQIREFDRTYGGKL